MKMIMAVTRRDEVERVLQALVAADHTATFVETRGGMLRQAQMTLFIAVQDEDLEAVLSIVEESCRSESEIHQSEEEGRPMPVRPRLGGAVIFVWDVERSETY